MKIAVWLRRKTGMDIIINALCQIFVNLLFYKILGNSFFLLCLQYHVFFCHDCSSVHFSSIMEPK